MSWWDSGREILGDGPADQITAAFRRVLVPRARELHAPPTVADLLAAFAACMRHAPVAPGEPALLAPALRRLVLRRAPAPALIFPGTDPAPADLLVSFEQALREIARQYQSAFARPPTPMELAKTLAFVVRPDPADLLADADAVLGKARFDVHADPEPVPAQRDLVCVIVGVAALEAERLLSSLLGEGSQQLAQLSHPSANAVAEPVAAQLEALDPDAEALTFHETQPATPEPPSTILHRRSRTPPRLGLAQLRPLSRLSGGWVLAAELGPRPRFAAFFLGRSVEIVDLPDEASAWSALAAAHAALTGGSADELRGLWCAPPHTRVVLAPAPRFERPLPPLHLTLLQTSLAEVQAAAASLPAPAAPLRALERSSPMSTLPFTLLEGPLAPDWSQALSDTLGCALTALTLDEDTMKASFVALSPGKPAATEACSGAVALAARWGQETICLGDAPAVVAWPAGEAGVALGGTSAT
jgi:hypothetical protein